MDTLPIRDQKKSIMMTSRQKAEARNKWYNAIQTSKKKKLSKHNPIPSKNTLVK